MGYKFFSFYQEVSSTRFATHRWPGEELVKDLSFPFVPIMPSGTGRFAMVKGQFRSSSWPPKFVWVEVEASGAQVGSLPTEEMCHTSGAKGEH
jgi:hypothetical protein